MDSILDSRLTTAANTCPTQLDKLSKTQAYFQGKEDLLNFFRAQNDIIVLTPNDLDKIKNEAHLKGFEKGKDLMRTNFKIWLEEASKWCLK